MTVRKVAMLTAGGLAPCLSAAVGGLIERYTEIAPNVRIDRLSRGLRRLLRGRSIEITPEVRASAGLPRTSVAARSAIVEVKLTNVDDCVKSAASCRMALTHCRPQPNNSPAMVSRSCTIGGDDTNTTAADLAAYLHQHGYELTVVGLPKTIDNDVFPDQAIPRCLDGC